MKLTEILNNNIINNDSIQSLINEYYSLDNFTFDTEITIDNDFNKELLVSDKELVILDKEYLLNNFLVNPEQFLSYNNGVILFDLSMGNDNDLYKSIELLANNYSNINLHKFNDNYLLEFDTKENKQINNLKNNLKNLFISDLNNLIIQQQINNIPNVINNEQFNVKIKEDLYYLDIINKTYSSNLDEYKNNLTTNLNSDEYKVLYVFEDNIQSTNKEQYSYTLNKLKEYNNYIDEISIKINKQNSNKQIELNKLFDITELNNLHLNNKSYMIFEMNDVLDTHLDINYLDKKITNDIFYNNVFKFLNELIKRKIIKIIKLNNFIQLK